MLEVTMKLSEENVNAIAKRMVEIQNKKPPETIKFSEKTQYTVNEVAEMSKKTSWTIRQHIKHNLLTASKVGKSWLISQEDYQKYITNEQ
jgi:excisionase family DNA binding protein